MKSPAASEVDLRVEVYSDLICPWCYIGKRRMEDGLALLGADVSWEIIWRPFELNPEMPAEGLDRKTYRSRKFGSWERSVAMDRDVTANGAAAGVEFNFEKIDRTPNTFLGHRLLWLARKEGTQNQLNDVLLRAYFTEGCDIGDAPVLAAIAKEGGMDPEKVAAFLASSKGADEVRAEERRAHEMGLTGVPFFIVNGVPAFSGAQLPAHFAEVFQAARRTGEKCGAGSCGL
jgi:predicted DsbA family dithiol-disulfide isomerase